MANTLKEQKEAVVTSHVLLKPRFSRMMLVAGILAIVVGFGSAAGGVVGAIYTWDQAATQNVTTPEDASIPEAAVRGPLTMLSEAAIITEHQLAGTDGLYYAEMPRLIEQVDENGAVVLDENGEAVMVPNEARASWLNATTLTTSLSLGVMAYALAAFAFVVGLVLMVVGGVFIALRTPEKITA